MDEERLEFGENIGDNLFKAIEQSSICIPIISPNYATSRWCLLELAKMVECDNKTIIPVFFHVDPSDVRKQKGPFEAAFIEYENRPDDKNKIEEWRTALRQVGALKGFDLENDTDGHEAKFIQLVVKEVLDKLHNVPLHLTGHLIGIDSRVEDVMKLLSIKETDVRMIAMVGMGGIGKTTISKVIYNKIFREYNASSFISDIREGSKGVRGLESLQQKLVSDILKDDVKINCIDQRKTIIKQRFSQKKVLIVVDDVDSEDQLKALAGEKTWFGCGSRIIITTRDEHVLNVHDLTADKIYRPNELNDDDSVQLFSYHAFRRERPTEEYVELSRKVVSTTGGLPLALEVIGSLLFDKRDPDQWEELLEELKDTTEIQERLRISYDVLTDEAKKIFLDIACFFIGRDQYYAITFWRGCEQKKIKLSIETLQHRCLIKIGESNEFEMHDQLRDMGRGIVSKMHPPEKQSRLWSADKVLDVLNHCKGSTFVEGIDLDHESTRELFNTKSFEAMTNLKLLRANGARIQGDFRHMPKRLQWLEWRHCPLESLPNDFNLDKIAVLDISNSGQLTKVWSDGWLSSKKMLNKLRILDLSKCIQLKATPDFSSCPNLERLFLSGAQALIKLHESIGNMYALRELVLSGSGIKVLPESIGFLHGLHTLNLCYCYNLRRLPGSLGQMKGLSQLYLEGSGIEELPESIGFLHGLHTLDLSYCVNLKWLPGSLDEMKGLSKINLKGSGIVELSESIGFLHGLHTLDLFGCENLRRLPGSLGQMKGLSQLPLVGCGIEELPESIGFLHGLHTMDLSYCVNLKMLPDSIDKIKGLSKINLKGSGIEKLPESIGFLHVLHTLDLSYCVNLKRLPDSLDLMKGLNKINLKRSSIEELPDSMGFLHGLHTLNLYGCENLRRLPGSLGQMKGLSELYLVGSGIEELPESIGFLHGLHTLNLSYCYNLRRLPDSLGQMKGLSELYLVGCIIDELPKSIVFLHGLHTLNLSYCKNLRRLPCFLGQMKELSMIDFAGSGIEELPDSIEHLQKPYTLCPKMSSAEKLGLG